MKTDNVIQKRRNEIKKEFDSLRNTPPYRSEKAIYAELSAKYGYAPNYIRNIVKGKV